MQFRLFAPSASEVDQPLSCTEAQLERRSELLASCSSSELEAMVVAAGSCDDGSEEEGGS